MDNIAHYMDVQEITALLFFILCWTGYARYAPNMPKIISGTYHLLAATNRYRTLWMREMLKRDNRSVDAIMVGNLQRSITFFANTTIFLVIGLIGMLGYHDRASPIFGAIPFAKAQTTPFLCGSCAFSCSSSSSSTPSSNTLGRCGNITTRAFSSSPCRALHDKERNAE